MPLGKRPRLTLEERFWAKVQRTDSCWVWTGALTHKGYGVFHDYGNRTIQSHCFAYEHFVGSIPGDLEIDHLCRNRACVNPAHLEPVTHRTNILRGTALITHCPQGHAYDEANTRFDLQGHRLCRTCRNTAVKDYKHRIKGVSDAS